MIIHFSAQRSDNKIRYEFENEKIIAIMEIPKIEYEEVENEDGEIKIVEKEVIEELTDAFDFSDCPDGVLEEVETILPVNLIVSAKRENGLLEVTLLKFHGPNAPYEERFPESINTKNLPIGKESESEESGEDGEIEEGQVEDTTTN